MTSDQLIRRTLWGTAAFNIGGSLVFAFPASTLGQFHEFPTEAGLAELERMGVDYVIVHTDMYQPDRWALKERDLAKFAGRIRLVRVEGEGRAYAIRTPGGA